MLPHSSECASPFPSIIDKMQCHRRRRRSPQQFLNYRYTNRTWHHDQLMLGIFSSSKRIFILKRNSVTENVQLTLESYLRLAKFLLLSGGKYWSFKNTVLDIRWVYLSMEEWFQTTRASLQITFSNTYWPYTDIWIYQKKKKKEKSNRLTLFLRVVRRIYSLKF